MSNSGSQADTSRSGRRKFLFAGAIGGAYIALSPWVGAAGGPGPQSSSPDRPGSGKRGVTRRAREAYKNRIAAARAQLSQTVAEHPDNGDEQRYDDLRASFFKTLPQNEYGEVDVVAFRQLRRALADGDYASLETVPLSPGSARALANPLGSHAFEMVGPDGWALDMRPAPQFSSSTQAAEMCEVYWQAVTRDVPFREFDSRQEIAAAVEDLDGLSQVIGAAGSITTGSVFRGQTPGDLVGPYISQFLWQPTHWGLVELDQQFALPLPGEDFGTSHGEWLSMQRGEAPLHNTRFESSRRYISTGRDLAEYVHGDVVYQAYLTAAMIMLGYGADALDPENPYLNADIQAGFVTHGAAEIVDLVAKVAHAALKAAWYQKWMVHRRLRPEAFAARVQFQAAGERDYGLPGELFETEVVSRLQSLNGNLFLPLAYPEGSPTHPSYPAGHAAVAGACATVLKAVFDEDFEIPDPVESSADGTRLDPWSGTALTIGGEVNKLAANITLGRDVAGVHYRSDGIEGITLGEQVALGVLADYAITRLEPFAGFRLTRFDGTPVAVSGNGIEPQPAVVQRPRGSRRELRQEHF